MKKITLMLLFLALSAAVAGAQSKSLTGRVVAVERGMYAWEAIVVQVGAKKYLVYTSCGDCDPKIVGKVDVIGRQVTFSYSRIEAGSDGYHGEVKATRIAEIKRARKK